MRTMKYSIVASVQPAQFQAATLQGDLENNLRQLKEIGYTGVELAIREPASIDQDGLVGLIKRFGLSVPAIGTGQAWGEEGLSFSDPEQSMRKRAVERLKSHFPLAGHLDALVIIGLLRGTARKGVNPEQALEWLVEAFRECCAAAREKGVRLALEPINRYETNLVNTAVQGIHLLDTVGAENLGLLLDTFHMNIEEASIEKSIQVCRGRIFHFHVADSNRMHPGAGHLDFHSILEALDSTDYTGWISGEFLPLPDAKIAAERNLEYFRKMAR